MNQRVVIVSIGAVAVVAVLVAGAAMVWAGGGRPPTTRVAELPSPGAVSAEPTESTVEADSAPASSAPPSASPSRTRRPPVQPSRRATQIPGPPPPPATTKTSGCPTYAGPKAPMADVKAALNTAAARTYWPNSAPTIKVPLKLVYAVAWQESGWQSTIIACDGGVGTMQVMRPTAEWMNTRFETSWNIDTLSGNTYLGAQFLAWLIKYMGDLYFAENYDFYDPATGEVTNENLLNAVIAAYNVGHGKVDPTKATPYPNPRYVQNVRALMVSCPCTAG